LIIVSAIQEEPGHFLTMALQSTPWATTHSKAGAQRLPRRSPMVHLRFTPQHPFFNGRGPNDDQGRAVLPGHETRSIQFLSS
jgi:hypothetical protein